MSGDAPRADPGRPGVLAVRARRLLDVRAGRWVPDPTVVMAAGRIQQVGGTPPAGAAVLDLGDRSLLPGLIDAHTHVLLQGNATRAAYAHQVLEEEPAHRVVRAVRSMRVALEHGFTTLRDLGTEGAGFADVALRDAVAERVVPGPRLFAAGPAIGATGTYPILGYRSDWTFPVGVAECDGVAGCRREVRRQLARGVDWIKVYCSAGRGVHRTDDGYLDSPPTWTAAELRALVDEAHAGGAPVAAHAASVTGTEMAVAAGVDSIEHGYAIRPAAAERMAAAGIALVPTLLVTREILDGRLAERGSIWAEVPAMHRRSFANCRAAGVTLVLGTDVGGFDWLGASQVGELEILVELGLTPLEAIRSATVDAARLLRQEGVLGEVTPGASADLIACPGDPLATVTALRDVDVVVREGDLLVQPADLRLGGTAGA
ncbi:MAG TPA: amidohydrolase family protein [Candidatus Micrarchaeia archaeon]|nr:amidohydrolase family protein [Candidatus Micrarchaeia archaeon]